ncbi:flagellar biosynthesis protein FlhF [Evansella vedderi]|uniref:Flagellar biosynthesis protein FlhF n=1 Tax=Evansella vedderi TaxID=38282 RepID=A0ABT9ZR41_9BACI|nr:flagellar biosynthesis protein FlhF [Evansella vedderi]MDQ0253695.1 flagellar biosynthesis protein FlhF [Evansella vedderi]
MKVKKIIARNMPEAMTKVRAELGNDAVILNSKEVYTGGFLGFFTKKNMEVIAAVDPVKPQKTERMPTRSPIKHERQRRDKIAMEIAELKRLVKGINEQQQEKTLTLDPAYPGYLQNINQRLLEEEVKEVHRLQIMKQLLKRWYSENGEEEREEQLLLWLKEAVADYLNDVEYGPFLFKKRYLNVVGPTGVGKTTTLAKIASRAAILHQKKIAFITTDTYRIAAIEQLKTYAKILNVPIEVAYSIDDFKLAKERLKNFDFILVDSAGRNFRNPLYVEQLREVIDFDDEMETHLVLSLTSKYRDMKNIMDQFQKVKINKVIYTKADETDTYGAMINIHGDYKIGASYITTGQNVPDDILEASKETVIDRILRS